MDTQRLIDIATQRREKMWKAAEEMGDKVSSQFPPASIPLDVRIKIVDAARKRYNEQAQKYDNFLSVLWEILQDEQVTR